MLFSGQDFLVYESNCPPRRVFSHVGPQKPRVFTWFRDFHAFLCPPVAPRGQRSHENAVRNHLSKGPSRQLRDRSAQGPWLSGRFGCASTTGDPATEPLRLKRGPWSEANCGCTVVANANTLRKPQRLPQVNSPKSPPPGSHPPAAGDLKIQRSLA